MNDSVAHSPIDQYIDKLKNARKSPAVLKTKLATLRGEMPNCIVFAFEGGTDKAVYVQWVKRIRPDLAYEPFPCDGKDGVFQLQDMLARDLGNLGSKVYFFVDRDYDDLRGRPPNASTFMTDQYSVENYLVAEDVLEEVLKDEFDCHAEPRIRAEIISLFREQYDAFLKATEETNRRLHTARTIKVKLAKSLPDKINQIATIQLTSISSSNQSPDAIVIFKNERSEADIRLSNQAFAALNPKERYRGKFALMFFMKWLELLSEDRRSPASKHFSTLGKPRSLTMQSLSLGMLASKSSLPTGLGAFIAAV